MWLDTDVPDTTTHSPERGGKESTMDFSTIPHGLLAAGTATPQGVIVGRSYTAYEMADGQYVAFSAVHGAYSAASPLVVLR